MAKQITPGTPPTIEAKLVDVKTPSFKAFDELGDAKIKAANQNFELYADNLIKTESAKLYEQYKTNPIELSNALGKLPEMLSDLPPEIQEKMTHKSYLQAVSLVQKAENNQLVQQDLQNKQYTDAGVEQSKSTLAETYQNILQNHIATAENKNPVMDEIFLSERLALNNYADLTDHNGKNVYSETQRKQIKNVDDIELAGFKQFFDTMLLNDNDELQNSKDYYTKFLLAPERFMKENYMNRETYDKARAYAEHELKRAGVEIKNARFNQSIKDAMALQTENLPGKLEELKESGYIDKRFVENIEKVNAKFDRIDPSKPESPVAMLEMLSIVNSWQTDPTTITDEQKLTILAQGTAALDLLATYGEEYGMSEKSVKQARDMVVMKENNLMYGEMLNKFGMIQQSFGTEIPNIQDKITAIRGEKAQEPKSKIDMLSEESQDILREYQKGNIETSPIKLGQAINARMPTRKETIKLTMLNNTLAVAEDLSRQALKNGDLDRYNQIQQELPKKVAQIKYYGIVGEEDWTAWQQNPDHIFMTPDGTAFQIDGFTPYGDIIIRQ